MNITDGARVRATSRVSVRGTARAVALLECDEGLSDGCELGLENGRLSGCGIGLSNS
jgi:hypothetical protein